MNRKHLDSRVSSIWGHLRKLLDETRDAVRDYFGVSNAEISRKFPLTPDSDQYPQCARFVDAIETTVELIDIFGTDLLEAIAEQFGCRVIDPERNIFELYKETLARHNTLNDQIYRNRQKLIDLQRIASERGVNLTDPFEKDGSK